MMLNLTGKNILTMISTLISFKRQFAAILQDQLERLQQLNRLCLTW